MLLQTSKTMTASINPDGLPARQKADPISKKVRLSKTLWIFLASLFVMLSSCHESTKGQDNEALLQDSLSKNKPKVNVKVNRHYDDKGNVIGFDSTYTSYYSNIEGDTGRMDSLMKSFDSYFDKKHSNIFRNELHSLFFNDSAGYPDFFHNDFFLKRYETNDSYFRDMMNRMDSIKNRFYKDHIRDQKRDL